MSIDPEAGLVIRYDFLWKKDEDAGLDHGRKERPCAVILILKTGQDGSKTVIVCPITHSPVRHGETGVEIPRLVSRHLGLDGERSWIKTHEVNTFVWEKDRIPFGVTPAHEDQWAFGYLPHSLAKQAFDQVRENSLQSNLEVVRRENDIEDQD